jgi:murein DD-endopeptidase MepM/ murein hydrolase activator NlpD
MDKKITFIIASNVGSSIKQVTISKTLLTSLFFVFLAGLIVTGYVAYDYLNLKFTSLNINEIEKRADRRQHEIESQRKQIKLFANEINSLKSQIVDLNEFEKKIRIIANIEKSADQENVFGVGGSIPEDLDTNIDLRRKNSSFLREMHEQVGGLNLAKDKQKDGFESLLHYLENQRNLLASTPAICPTRGWITSRFGYRTSPFTGLKEFHKGLDIATGKGTAVIATANGTVTFVGKKGFLGKVVVLDHGLGIITRYAHLEESLVKSGALVKRGDKIGQVGMTGRTTGSHLHYDVRINGVQVNPEKYIIN